MGCYPTERLEFWRRHADHLRFLTRRRVSASLTERFQSRFQPVRLQPPENEIAAAFLARLWGAHTPSPARSRKGQGQRQGRDGGLGDVVGVTK